jgi:hypothetical protein
MSNSQGIIFLFILLVIALSMGKMFYTKESFINGTGLGFLGHQLNKPMNARPNLRNGNVGYEGMGYIGLVNRPTSYKVRSDDNPLSYGFPLSTY